MPSLPNINHPCTRAIAPEQAHHCCPEHQCTAPYVIGAGAGGAPGGRTTEDNLSDCTGGRPFPSCPGCRFWDAFDARSGECRRHAPTAVQFAQTQDANERGGDSGAVWPVTSDDDWCGEWEAKP